MKLTIKNYQGHEESELEFVSPGINAIVGKNGHGKSSIFRALRSVPLGDSLYRRKRTRETIVTIDGCTKGYVKSKNIYRVDDTEFKALRNLVPKEVTDRLQLKEINFRSQHNQYFLLQDSPGAVARTMNELTDLGVIDYVASALKSEGASLKTFAEVQQKDIEKLRLKIASTDWAVAADEDLKDIECIKELAEEMEGVERDLQNVIEVIIKLNLKLSSLPSPSEREKLDSVESSIRELETTALSDTLDEILNMYSWLYTLPENLTIPLALVTKRMSEAPETAPLEKCLDLITEYSTDLRLCPDPKLDISALASISFPDCGSLETLVGNVVELYRQSASFAKLDGWEDDLKKIERLIFDETKIEELRDGCVSYLSAQEGYEKCCEVYDKSLVEFNELLLEAGNCPLCGRMV